MSERPRIPAEPTAPGALGAHMLDDARAQFRGLRKLAEGAMGQVDDVQFFASLDAEANSIAVIVKHVAGNLRSRWTDFLTSDGEKPDRNRDGEFEIGPADSTDAQAAGRAALDAAWRRGWDALEGALAPLGPDDLLRTIAIRGEPHTVVQAIHRQLAHYGNHVGQIVLLAKHARGGAWKTLSVPRGGSTAFERATRKRFDGSPGEPPTR